MYEWIMETLVVDESVNMFENCKQEKSSKKIVHLSFERPNISQHSSRGNVRLQAVWNKLKLTF